MDFFSCFRCPIGSAEGSEARAGGATSPPFKMVDMIVAESVGSLVVATLGAERGGVDIVVAVVALVVAVVVGPRNRSRQRCPR
jgi:hypothetical protein